MMCVRQGGIVHAKVFGHYTQQYSYMRAAVQLCELIAGALDDPLTMIRRCCVQTCQRRRADVTGQDRLYAGAFQYVMSQGSGCAFALRSRNANGILGSNQGEE